ncbi:acyltransferase [Peptoniphilus sp. EMRHCC_23]|uniref:acyltransferase family protein n=1 Tax=Peptoniphilus rachelemmaiella TaxID=2811779 RepID=UPI001BFFE32B|nr:acyltransferase family protein [Peptoniphilus rachelemmaiella]
MHKEIKSFTGLRALALWGVILYHLYPHKIVGGYLGVVMFFLLSGYLLMGQHLSEKNHAPLKKFAKQYKKLTPPLVFVVAVVVFIAAIAFHGEFRDVAASGISAIFGVNNYQQILRGFSYFDLHGKFLPFTHFWALSAQLQFYLIWAILRTFCGKNRGKLALSLVVTGGISLLLMPLMTPFTKDITRIYYGTDTRYFAFAMGALAGLIGEKGSFKGSQKAKTLPAAGLLLLMLLSFAFFRTSAFLYYGGMALFSIVGAALLLYTAKDDNATAKALGNPLLRYFGTRSYELYLWQYPVMLVFQQAFSHSELSYFVVVLLQLPVLFILGEVTYRLFKRPVKKRIWTVSAAALALMTLIGTFAFSPARMAAKEKAEAKKIEAQEKEAAKAEAPEPIDDENLSDEIKEINRRWPQVALGEKEVNALAARDGLMIGDSLTEMEAEYIKLLLPKFTVDGMKNRQMKKGLEVLQSHDLSALSEDAPIVIQLGTNYDFNTKVLDEIIAATGEHPVYLVNTVMPDPWEEPVNEKLANAAKASKRVHLIDWHKIAKEEDELFISDHTHPKNLGLYLFPQVVAKGIMPSVKPVKAKPKEDKAPDKKAGEDKKEAGREKPAEEE